MKTYEKLSQIYDKSMILSNVDYDKWMNKIFTLMGNKKNEIKNILELGCGTGNITKRLLDAGYEVVGIDISQEMLEICRNKNKKYKKELILLQQDILDIDFDVYEIDMILASNDIINYIIDEKDLINLLKFCIKHLKKGGLFLFDISSSYKIKNILSNNTFFEEDDDYCLVWQNFYDEIKCNIEMYVDIFIKQGEDIYKRFQEEHIQKKYEEEEIKKLLYDIGFKNIKKEYFYYDNSKNLERIFFSALK